MPLLSASASLFVFACFIDNGSVTSTGSQSSEVTGTDTMSSTTTSTTTNSTDPTSSSASTHPTHPTDSTDPSSTEPDCEECKPGATETSRQCGSCGLNERTCSDECTWGPYTCVEHQETCAYWRLPAGTDLWQHHALVAKDDDATHAPKTTVRAAFDINARREGFVFTETMYHVINLDSRKWTRSGNIQQDLPELANETILAAFARPDGEGSGDKNGEDDVTIITPTTAYPYVLSHITGIVKPGNPIPCCDDNWKGINVPKTATIRAFWLAIDDADPWEEIPLDTCEGAPANASLLHYGAGITNSNVHLQDASYCFDFMAQIPFANWKPFTFDSGPQSGADVGAAFLNNGELWVFRGK